jgi:hypothetical protein
MAVGDLGRELVEPLCSAPDARASFLLRRQKKRAKEKATPGRRPACGGVPCATRLERGLRNSGCATRASPSDSARPQPCSSLRCSAPLRGMLKTIGFSPPSHQTPLGFPLALCVVEQRRAQRKKGRGLSEGRSPEFRSPPLRSSSAENPAQPGDAAGARFLWVLSFGKTKESTSPAGETQRFSPPPPPENTKRQETWQMAHPE